MKLIIDVPENIIDIIEDDQMISREQLAVLQKHILDGIPYEERPQGEWEESHIFSCGNMLRMGMNVIEHKCKNCGRWSIKWVTTMPDNFCPNCGAKMVGGEP